MTISSSRPGHGRSGCRNAGGRPARVVRHGDSEFWVYEDRQIVTTGLNAMAGKRREGFSPNH
jgi:hypothetical protein